MNSGSVRANDSVRKELDAILKKRASLSKAGSMPSLHNRVPTIGTDDESSSLLGKPNTRKSSEVPDQVDRLSPRVNDSGSDASPRSRKSSDGESPRRRHSGHKHKRKHKHKHKHHHGHHHHKPKPKTDWLAKKEALKKSHQAVKHKYGHSDNPFSKTLPVLERNDFTMTGQLKIHKPMEMKLDGVTEEASRIIAGPARSVDDVMTVEEELIPPTRTHQRSISDQKSTTKTRRFKLNKAKSMDPTVARDITDVIVVKRLGHGHYDEEKQEFVGQNLPEEIEKALKVQFGLPLQLYKKESLAGYDHGIPSVLIALKQNLLKHKGLDQVGIFRLAAEMQQLQVAKEQINAGTFESCDDCNVVATLIKIWFRDLPNRILLSISPEDVRQCNSKEEAWALLKSLPELKRSVYMWLLDLCVEVTRRSHVNRMTPQNMAIVLSPNLYVAPEVKPDLRPEEAIKVMDTLKKYTKLIEWNIEYRADTISRAVSGLPRK